MTTTSFVLNRCVAIALAVIFICPSGCLTTHAKIAMERLPDGQIRRDITVWSEDDGKVIDTPAEKLAPIRAIYGEPTRDQQPKYRFSTKFADEIPQDLLRNGEKNYGIVTTSGSRMGSVLTYTERMAGSARLTDMIESAQKFVDISIRALIAYAEQVPELVNEPEKRRRLREFLDKDLRRDATDLLLSFMRAFAQQPKNEAAIDTGPVFQSEVMRALLFLQQSGYLSRHCELFGVSHDAALGVVMSGVLHRIAAALGYDPADPLPPGLAKFEDPEQLSAAFDAGMKAIGVTKGEFENVARGALGGMDSLEDMRLTVTWRAATKPVATNGVWDEFASSISWATRTVGAPWLPDVLFATWTEPAKAFQGQHFGRVVVVESLAEYNAWRLALPPEHARSWDAFIDSLKPGDELAQKLADFRLATEPATKPGESKQSSSNSPVVGAALILAGLKAAPPVAPTNEPTRLPRWPLGIKPHW